MSPSSILSLDVGEKRIGIAVASRSTRLARPMTTLTHDSSEDWLSELDAIVESEGVDELVIGRPRNLQGQVTAQTATIEAFRAELQKHFQLPIHMQDEALTSQKAEDELRARGKPYQKGDIDALAATYILEDFLKESPDQDS